MAIGLTGVQVIRSNLHHSTLHAPRPLPSTAVPGGLIKGRLGLLTTFHETSRGGPFIHGPLTLCSRAHEGGSFPKKLSLQSPSQLLYRNRKMPNLLKKLFRPSSKPRYKVREPTSPLDLVSSPTRSQAHVTSQTEIDDLTRLAQRVLGSTNSEGSSSSSRSKKKQTKAPKKDTSKYLADQVESQLHKRATADAGGIKREKVRKAKKAVVVVEPVAPTVARWAGDDGQKVMNAIIESLGKSTRKLPCTKDDGTGV